jgi:hypothetical protein
MSDNTTCPISGKLIGPGEGEVVMSKMGNMWIVHPSVPPNRRRLDVKDEGLETIEGVLETINGVRPVAGPHSTSVVERTEAERALDAFNSIIAKVQVPREDIQGAQLIVKVLRNAANKGV